jgi:hypothetical protein
MVSQLWTACSEGNLETVLGILNDASSVDIEIRGVLLAFLILRYHACRILISIPLSPPEIRLQITPGPPPSSKQSRTDMLMS